MAQIISQNDLWGRVGRNLGEGLGDQFSKEIQNKRLSSALGDIENSSLSPLQQQASLIRSGATESQINNISPHLRNSSIRNSQRGNQGLPVSSQSDSFSKKQPDNQTQISFSPSNPRKSINQGAGENTVTLKTPEGERASRQPLPVITQDEIENRARQLIKEKPEIYQGENAYPQALARASEELSEPLKRQAAEIDASGRQAGLEQEAARKFTQKFTDKGIDLTNITPEVLQRAQKKTDFDILNGMTAEQASENQTNLLQRMNKNIVSLNNNIGQRPFFGKATDEMLNSIQRLKKPFEEAGELVLFKDKQKTALDIGDHLASLNTFPPTAKQFEIANSSSKEDPKKLAAQLARTVDEKTSLFSLGYLIAKAGGDDQKVIQELDNLEKNGVFNFKTDEQAREAAEYYGLNQQLELGDVFYESIFGLLGGASIRSLAEYLGLAKSKLGPIEKIKRQFGKE